MYYVYIIRSLKDNSYYVGQTQNVVQRLERHNLGFERYTKHKTPWELVYIKTLETRKEAMSYEKNIKSMKRRSYLENLIKQWDHSSTG